MSENKNISILSAYVENMVTYLKNIQGTISLSNTEIEQFVKTYIQENIKRPVAEVITYPSYGNHEIKEVDLLKYLRNVQENIITPSGGVYCKTSTKVSLLTKLIIHLLNTRKIYKKQMFEALDANNTKLAFNMDCIQNRQKISCNGLSGAFNSPYNCLYNKENYNATTALARGFVTATYAFVEKFLENNYYLPTENAVINYIVIHEQNCPQKETIDTLVKQYKLYEPSTWDVLDFFTDTILKYKQKCNKLLLQELILKLPQHVLTFIFYEGNLSHIIRKNAQFFIPFIHKLFDESIIDFSMDIPIEELFTKDENLINTLVSVVFEKYTHKVSIYKLAHSKTPEDIQRVKKFLCIVKHIEKELNSIDDLLSTFLSTTIDIPDHLNHKLMFRNTVVTSDTDSALFSTNPWTEWYRSHVLNYTNTKDVEINQLVVYLLVVYISKFLHKLSEDKGATKEDSKHIAIKNEYYYPVYSRTPLKKTYIGLKTIREGIRLKNLDIDIKGLVLKSSTLQSDTLQYNVETINMLIQDVKNDKEENFNIPKYIQKTIDLENMIYSSLNNGETKFLEVISIKNSEEYKNVEASIHFNYNAWNTIFGEKYSIINIPVKTYIIPLIKKPSKEYFIWLSNTFPDIYNKWNEFFKDKTKGLTRIPIAPLLEKIPEELMPILDRRTIVFKNTQGMRTLLSSLSIHTPNLKNTGILFRDVYNNETTNITNDETYTITTGTSDDDE